MCDSFGNVHAHQSLGLRDLGHGFYECRRGLKLRLLFELISAFPQGPSVEQAVPSKLLYFHTLGDHDDVRKFLKRHR